MVRLSGRHRLTTWAQERCFLAKYILGHSLRKVAQRSVLLQGILRAADLVCIGAPLTILGWLPADTASYWGRRLLSRLGPRLAKSRVIRSNLVLAFPDKSQQEIDSLVTRIWGNAGAVFAEYAHLETICDRQADERLRVSVRGEIETFLKPAKPAVFVTAHQANWEMAAAAVVKCRIPLAVVFSPPDNPWFARRLIEWRQALGCQMLPRDDSMRPMIRAISEGRSIGIVMDRRVDSGKPIPFFGMDKWTTIVPARLALRYGCDLVPVRVERLENSHFEVVFFPPVRPDNSEDHEIGQAIQMTTKVNQYFEQWIRAKPQDWFCSKRLWPKRLGTTDKPESANLNIHSNAA